VLRVNEIMIDELAIEEERRTTRAAVSLFNT